ncbi:MAG TPA: HEAT repeat domain-containing protein [Kofleriaceae bacterium]|nr:HEAT repeat domain-containing protein [Kofleriaceae bacterium]
MRPRSASVVGAPIGGDPGGDPGDFVGQELGGYLIRRKLAEGGMGEVFEGVHQKIGRLGAIKVLKPEFCRSEDVVERFHQEARAVNAIRHENIVDIYDFGRDRHGRVFFVMEYLEGEPLSARIRRGALLWSEAFPILEQTLRALKAAHDKGFVHRDLKPDNIWLKYDGSRVQVKLLDFGIAKLVGAESPREKLTQTGSVIGTPHYMSPEQINGARNIDQRTDLYAMGVIMYEMFAGVTPFVGDTLQAIMTGHLFKEPPRLANIPANLGVPAPIAEIVDRMLAKDAAERYDSAADVLADLHDVNRNRLPTKAETLRRMRMTRAPTMGPQAAEPAGQPSEARRRGLSRTVGIGLVLAAAAGGGLAIWSSRAHAPAAPSAGVAPGKPGPAAPGKPAEPVTKPLDYDAVRKDAQVVLRASLKETEPAVRVQGSDALGKIKDQPSAPVLTELTEKDPDTEVRGHAADALGTIGASSAVQLLGKLEAGAPPPLKVWYASALARLGDKGAVKRLLGYAHDKDLAVSFKAGLTLADLSQPGDKNAIAALKALAAHEAELNSLAPYAGALILTKLAALRDASARKVLYGLLEHDDEGARLAAAEGLARLGDDAGRKVLQAVFANPASPNQLIAAVAQIPLGEYGGIDLITAKLDAKDPGARRLAARALGDIGDRKSLPGLIALARDKDWTIRIAAAAAIVAIVGLDPQVLAQASVDWTKGALESADWAVRKAAAGVLADLPEKQAVPLLAQAIADPDPKVRIAASKSAGKMKSADAAEKVTAAVKAETDPQVKEQQVKALGEIGSPVAHDTLAQIAEEPGRIGVFAAGSLVAVGDAAGKAKLDAAVTAMAVELRLAAVQAASAANKPIVVPTLKIGVADRVFDVRFTAAEGLATLMAERAAAVPVLTAALESKDAGVIGRAVAALTRLGEQIKGKVQTPAEMLDSADPRLRLAAVPIVRAMAASEGGPLVRRLVADPDPEVRHAGVDAIEDLAAKDKDQAIKLYKPLVSDADPVVRSKASGQLARLVPPPPQIAAVPAPAPAPEPAPPVPAVDDALPKVKLAFDSATAAAAEAKAQGAAFAALSGELATALGATEHDDTTIKHVEELAKGLDEAAAKLEAAAAKLEDAAKAVSDVAGASPSPDAAKLVEDARALVQDARGAATTARGKVADAADKARKYRDAWTGDPQMFLAEANAAIAAGDFADARRNLDRATKLVRASGTKNASLDDAYARLYDQMAARTQDPAAKRKLLQQAEEAYRRFAKTGAGPRVQRANDRLAEIADELKELGQP